MMIGCDPELSLVIPCHNEEGNLRALIDAIGASMNLLGITYEVIISDDCSKDSSWEILKEIAQDGFYIRILRLRFRVGKSAAIWSGIEISRGNYIVTLDADLQNDLSDLPFFVEALKSYDCVCGTRITTRVEGDSFIRCATSRISNWIRNMVLGDSISDSGCGYRAFRRACVSKIKYFNGAHRFMPALFKMEGFTVIEIPVKNNPRLSGKSHYGIWNRFFISFIDLLGVWWMKNRLISYEVKEKIN